MKANSILIVLLAAFVAAGCGEENSESTGIANPAISSAQAAEIVPSEADVQTTLVLNEEQNDRMRPALNRWRTGAEQSATGGQVMDLGMGCIPHPQLLMEFLEGSSEFLDDEQFVQLVQLIQERIEAWQESRSGGQGHDLRGRGQGAGRFGHGPGARGPQGDCDRSGEGKGHFGRHGGPGFERGQGPGMDLEQLTEDLGLTEEQVTLIQAYLDTRREEMRERRQSSEFDPAAWWEQRQERREAFEEFLNGLLTPEQIEQFTQLREERRTERFEERQTRMQEQFNRRAEFLATVLELTEEQQEQLAAVFQAHMEEMAEHFENRAGEDLTWEEHQQMRDENRQERIDAIKAILDEDQVASFEALENLFGSCPRGPRSPRG